VTNLAEASADPLLDGQPASFVLPSMPPPALPADAPAPYPVFIREEAAPLRLSSPRINGVDDDSRP
jgi:hypothetical protein